MNSIFCADSTPNFLNIFDLSIAPTLLFYTYIPVIIISTFLGFYVYIKSNTLEGKLFSIITALFGLWIIDVLMLWIVAYNNIIMFSWQITPAFEVPLFIFIIYFIYVATDKEKRDIPIVLKSFFLALMTVVFLLLPTNFNIPFYNNNINTCEGILGILWGFIYIFEIVAVAWVIGLCIKRYHLSPKTEPFRKEILYLGSGMTFFMILFIGPNIIGQLTNIQLISLWDSLGMIIFLSFLVFIIVKFKTFNIKLIATQALVWGLTALIGSQFFFIKVTTNFVLNGIGFLVSIILGRYLIKSVKKEIQQREQLALLNVSLQDLLKQRESLVHLITHKVKGSFTHSKYIFDGIINGTFGEATQEIKTWAEKGLESDNMGIETVDLVLNVANMQKGIIKYDMKNVDFKEIVLQSIIDKKVSAEAKGLKLESEITDGVYNVFGDPIWLKEVVNNLIENSIKYTREGSITVGLKDGNKKILLSVKDTGVGITEEDKKNLFAEGGRGKESLKINIDSTGYGLYSVKLILEAHKGRVWVESEVGKGSTFFVELVAI
ncbi:MAG: HAMP domain-containing sensor histidine kinase [bacterium]